MKHLEFNQSSLLWTTFTKRHFQMSEAPKKKVLWLTNLPAPYRFPIWDRMSQSADLTVVFLLKPKNWRNWPAPVNKNWNHKFMSFHSLQIDEYDIIPSFRGANKLLDGVDVAIIGGWETPMYIRMIMLAKKKRIPVIQFYESFGESHRFTNGIIPKIRKWIFYKSDKFLVISKQSEKTLIRMGIDRDRILTLFNPTDVAWLHTFAIQHRPTNSIGHKFLYVGQLIERKNVAALICAFANICTDQDSLTIAGKGPLKKNLMELTKNLGLSNQVYFVGHLSPEEIALIYASSNTLVLASTNEVWGLVVNEALASGLHVVVSHKCGVTNFVKGMKGVYIHSADKKSLENAMKISASQWKGYISEPEILNFTPEKFADEVTHYIQGFLRK